MTSDLDAIRARVDEYDRAHSEIAAMVDGGQFDRQRERELRIQRKEAGEDLTKNALAYLRALLQYIDALEHNEAVQSEGIVRLNKLGQAANAKAGGVVVDWAADTIEHQQQRIAALEAALRALLVKYDDVNDDAVEHFENVTPKDDMFSYWNGRINGLSYMRDEIERARRALEGHDHE